MRIALLGLGLIGGSIARALRERGSDGALRNARLVAWTPSGDGPEAAAGEGVIDEAVESAERAVADADLVVLAGPAPVCLEQLDALAGPWRAALAPEAIVTDVASTKAAIVGRAETLGLRFVGGHPMAGRETSGYGAAEADLFEGRPWVVVPTSDADAAAVERVEELARAVGARPRRMAADEHDAAVAAISHLPLVVAAALVDAIAGAPDRPREGWPLASELAATGWRDMTRLARGDVEMGSGIVATNARPIAARVRDLVEVLEGWLADLEGEAPNGDAITARLRAARDRLESMPG
jgi:prephenate dehydrogenase